MARSANALVCGLVTCAVVGCTTTQQEAARLRLNGARLRATQTPTRLLGANRQVQVGPVAVIRQGSATALVITVHNLGPRPVSDLPLRAGYRVGRRAPVYLNATAGLDYFQTHLPAIPAGGSLRWVLATGRLPSHARPFAKVGVASRSMPGLPGRLPRIRVTQISSAAGQLRLRIVNASSVPQYQLPVYAVASDGSRVVGAGQTSLAQLDSGATAVVTLRLLGHAAGGRVAVAAPPTIFS